jgi:hypothetical protein
MEDARFDRLAKALGRGPLTRRTVLGGAGIGIASAALAHGVAAQEVGTAVPGDDPEADVDLLFIQTFAAAQLIPVSGEPAQFQLVLDGAHPSIVAFSDRPARMAGSVPVDVFLDMLGQSPADPPNAALVARMDEAPHNSVVVVEMTNPVWDSAAQTMTYDVIILGLEDSTLQFQAGDAAISDEGATFSEGSLFIDDLRCGDHEVHCYSDGADLGVLGKYGYRFSLGMHACRPSEGCGTLNDKCNASIAACGGSCIAVAPYFGETCSSCACVNDEQMSGICGVTNGATCF